MYLLPLVALFASTSSAVTVTINAQQEVFISEESPSTNYDGSWLWIVKESSGAYYNTLLDFDFDAYWVSYAYPDWEVTSATVSLYVRSYSPSTQYVRLYPILESWVESSVTWDTSYTYGIDVNTSHYDDTTLSLSSGWTYIDATDAVAAIHDGTVSTNHGLLVRNRYNAHIWAYDFEESYLYCPQITVVLELRDADGDGYTADGDGDGDSGTSPSIAPSGCGGCAASGGRSGHATGMFLALLACLGIVRRSRRS